MARIEITRRPNLGPDELSTAELVAELDRTLVGSATGLLGGLPVALLDSVCGRLPTQALEEMDDYLLLTPSKNRTTEMAPQNLGITLIQPPCSLLVRNCYVRLPHSAVARGIVYGDQPVGREERGDGYLTLRVAGSWLAFCFLETHPSYHPNKRLDIYFSNNSVPVCLVRASPGRVETTPYDLIEFLNIIEEDRMEKNRFLLGDLRPDGYVLAATRRRGKHQPLKETKLAFGALSTLHSSGGRNSPVHSLFASSSLFTFIIEQIRIRAVGEHAAARLRNHWLILRNTADHKRRVSRETSIHDPGRWPPICGPLASRPLVAVQRCPRLPLAAQRYGPSIILSDCRPLAHFPPPPTTPLLWQRSQLPGRRIAGWMARGATASDGRGSLSSLLHCNSQYGERICPSTGRYLTCRAYHSAPNHLHSTSTMIALNWCRFFCLMCWGACCPRLRKHQMMESEEAQQAALDLQVNLDSSSSSIEKE